MDLPHQSLLSVDVHAHDGDERAHRQDQGEDYQPVLHFGAAGVLHVAVDGNEEYDCHGEVEDDEEDCLCVGHVDVLVESQISIRVPHEVSRSVLHLLVGLLVLLLLLGASSVVEVLRSAHMTEVRGGMVLTLIHIVDIDEPLAAPAVVQFETLLVRVVLDLLVDLWGSSLLGGFRLL